MDERFLIDQRDELLAQLLALRGGRDQLANAAMSAADEMARMERLEPGTVADVVLQRSRRAEDQLAQMDEQIKSLSELLKSVEDRLARLRENS